MAVREVGPRMALAAWADHFLGQIEADRVDVECLLPTVPATLAQLSASLPTTGLVCP